MSTRPLWIEKPSPVTTMLKVVVLVLCCAIVVVPFLVVVSTSLGSTAELNRAGGYLLWPTHPTLTAYKAILAGGVVSKALLVSIGITVIGTVLSLATTGLFAYSLSRPGSVFHRPVLFLVLGSLLFSAGIIPNYLLINALGLLNNWASLILPTIVNGFYVVVMRAFFMELPDELFESARMDGASEFHIFTRIVLPLSKAVIAVIGLFYAVAYWNAFFNALIYITDNDKWPLSMVLRTFVVNNNPLGTDQLALGSEAMPPPQSIQMAILVVSIVPILIVYPFLQRHFAKGVLIGAIKG